jgi:hypothetical protein
LAIQSLLRFQDYQFEVTLNTGRWRWTTRVDVSQSVVTTQIRDIISPYGILRDSIPIPGEVAQAMADSITEVQQAYTPSILLGTTSLNFVLDEGRGVSEAQPVLVTNNGILGSLLSATVTSSSPYVFPLPANVVGLVANASGTFDVSADSTNLLALGSPYSAVLTVQSGEAPNSPQAIAITVTVRPKATISPSPTSLTFTVAAPLSGPFPPVPSQQISLSNSGLSQSVLNYQIKKLVGVPWLVSFAPVYGSINGGSMQPITVVVAPTPGMFPGTYTETLRITGYSSNMSVDVPVTLNIT